MVIRRGRRVRRAGAASPPETRAEPVHPVAATALIGLAALTAFLSIEPPLDDAFIVFRYVSRFLDGQGLTFNDAEYVEGYTSLTWTLLLSLASGLTGVEPHITAVALILGTIVLTAGAMVRVLRTLEVPAAGIYGALASMAVSVWYLKVCFIGLEFSLCALLLVLFLWALFSALRRPPARVPAAWVTAGLLGGAVVATRPEMILLLPSVLGVLWLFERGESVMRTALWLAVPWLLVVAAVVAWRLSYYGEWLPNSVIAKSHSPGAVRSLPHILNLLRDGAMYLGQAYWQNPGLAVVALLLLVRVWAAPAQRRDALLVFMPVVISHVSALQNGGDWMPYFRFVNAFVPLYVLGFFVLLSDWLRDGVRRAAAVLALFAALYVPSNGWAFEPRILPDVGRLESWFDLYRRVGTALGPVWAKGDVLAAEGIGIIGYTAPNIYIHDPMALTDRTLARDKTAVRNIYGRMNWRYTLGLDPAVILLHYWPHQRAWSRFAPAYPQNYAFYYVPWTDDDSRQCLYAIFRRDRTQRYAEALRSLPAVRVEYDDVVYPCPRASSMRPQAAAPRKADRG